MTSEKNGSQTNAGDLGEVRVPAEDSGDVDVEHASPKMQEGHDQDESDGGFWAWMTVVGTYVIPVLFIQIEIEY